MDSVCLDAIDDALARAVVYRMLSIAFRTPTEERLAQLGARNGFRIVGAALRRQGRSGFPAGGEARFQADRSRLEGAAADLALVSVPATALVADRFWCLFGHTARGPVCACETEWGPANGFQQPQHLADIAGYYLAFGLQSVRGADERVDHIACECEFMDFLNRKEALLLAGCREDAGRGETLEATRQAARRFLRDHLGRFGCAFAVRVMREDPGGYFGALGRVLQAFVEAECARVRVEVGPVDLAVRVDAPDDTPMACGSPGELLQIQRRP